MSLVAWTIVIGFIVGLMGRTILPGGDEIGVLVTTRLGISGALFGTVLGRALGMYGPQAPVSLIASILGAVIILMVYRHYFASSTIAR
jgi:uncharacterized membrane protein YeaQ/YmgE (transglycosylase-associated protein family)